MTEARIERNEPDPWGAHQFLQQATRFAKDGAQSSNSAEGRQVLLHNAVIAACDAILAVDGFQVVGSDGGHRLRLETVPDLLGQDLEDLFDRLEDVRASRGDASYRAGPVPEVAVEEAVVAVDELLAVAEAHIGPSLPP